MEEIVKIPIANKKFIYGTLNFINPQPDKLVIFVHGLFDNKNTHLIYSASHFLYNQGFTTFRFDLYSYKSDARHFSQCSLSQHSKDLDRVIKYFNNTFRSIFIIGHSYGCLTILRSELDGLTAISLWELSSFISQPPTYFKYDQKIQKYIFNTGYDILVERKFVDDLYQFPNELDMINSIKCPIQIAYANGPNGALKKSSKRYYENILGEKDILAIDGANHSFQEEGVEQTLFNGTIKWFNRFEK